MMKVSVQSIHFQADAKLVDFIEKKLTRLDRYFDKNRSVEAEVSLKLQDTGGPIHEKIIEIKLLLPGGWLIDKKTGRSFESAVTASADTLKRQLLRHKERTSSIPHIRFSDL
jgi:putative sigma-54 modulation protein